MSETVKFQSLKLNQNYEVQNYTEQFETDYGYCRVLLVSEAGSKKTFELFATPLLLKYINAVKPTESFNFTVKENKGKKFPFIEGYSQERNWVLLS